MNQRAEGQRLFFALWPDQGAHQGLAELRATLRTRVAGRWLSPSSFHLTLAFLRAVTETRLPDVIAVAGRISMPGFFLELDRWVWWPGPRVLALAPRSPPRELMDLARTLGHGTGEYRLRAGAPGFSAPSHDGPRCLPQPGYAALGASH
jgi:2'-5' RNA ligase